MPGDVAANENNVQRKHHGAAEHQRIAAIEPAQAFGRHGEKIQPKKRREGSRPNPSIGTPSFEDGNENGNHDHARSSNKGGLRRGGELQPGGLESVAAEHEEADLRAGPHGLAFKLA